LLDSTPEKIENDSLREEPSNEAFYDELDHSDCGIGAARAAGQQLGPAEHAVHQPASDHRRAILAAARSQRWQ